MVTRLEWLTTFDELLVFLTSALIYTSRRFVE